MPVIVVGADTQDGRRLVEALIDPGREVRAFVSDPSVGAALKAMGAKVAVGDVSDDSHIEGASTRCFSAILVTEAARDDRERSFASDEAAVLVGWAKAVEASEVRRVIWVSAEDPPPTRVREVAVVSPADTDLLQKVVDLDDAQTVDMNLSS